METNELESGQDSQRHGKERYGREGEILGLEYVGRTLKAKAAILAFTSSPTRAWSVVRSLVGVRQRNAGVTGRIRSRARSRSGPGVVAGFFKTLLQVTDYDSKSNVHTV